MGCAVAVIFAGLQAMPAQTARDSRIAALTSTNAHRVSSHLLNPREHPDYDRRAVKPPTWET